MGLTKKNCDICQNIMGSQCGFNGSGIGDGAQALQCKDFVLMLHKGTLERLTEMLNRRICPNCECDGYIVVTMLEGEEHHNIVSFHRKLIISPKQAAVDGLANIVNIPRKELLLEQQSKCELDDHLIDDLKLILEVLSK